MADPVMSNLPLRRVLDCVGKEYPEYQTRDEIHKTWSRRNPMEQWIGISNTLRRKIFKEKKEEKEKGFDDALEELIGEGYVSAQISRDHPSQEHVRFRKVMTFYKLTEKGKKAKVSVIKRLK